MKIWEVWQRAKQPDEKDALLATFSGENAEVNATQLLDDLALHTDHDEYMLEAEESETYEEPQTVYAHSYAVLAKPDEAEAREYAGMDLRPRMWVGTTCTIGVPGRDYVTELVVEHTGRFVGIKAPTKAEVEAEWKRQFAEHWPGEAVPS